MTSGIRACLILGLIGVSWGCGKPAQVVDVEFHPQVERPEYPTAMGPLVLIDEAHHNMHTAAGRYRHFAELVRMDGYDVRASTESFTADLLAPAKILVISNALHERNKQRTAPGTTDWSLPTPSAFRPDEIEAVVTWVKSGGSLLLIADHMPFPGAAEALAGAFGVRMLNGFAYDGSRESDGDTRSAVRGSTLFSRSDGTLAPHPITDGRSQAEWVDHVATFTGQAFNAEGDVEPLLVFGSEQLSIQTTKAWEFSEDAERLPVAGWYQGLVLRVAEGRVAVFGEAAMFTAQLSSGEQEPMGMNAPVADQNPRFILNLMHWLAGSLEG